MYGGYPAPLGFPGGAAPHHIERAIYGVPGGPEADVTFVVREIAASTGGEVRADNGSLRGDPAPGQRKRLAVWVAGRGVIEAWEGEALRVPPPNAGHHQIERAIYGVPGGPEADVTFVVREIAASSGGRVHADNGALRGDPAPGQRKRLAVWVAGGGVVEAWEGEFLQIPAPGYPGAAVPFSGGAGYPSPASPYSGGGGGFPAAPMGFPGGGGISWAAAQAGSWRRIDGQLVTISVGADGAVWGTNAGQQIYRKDWIDAPWVQVPGALVQVSCGSAGQVVGVNASDSIYRFVPSRNDWEQLPGALRWVSVGADGAIWGVNGGQQIFRWNGAGGWDCIPGAAVQVSVGDAGNVWVVNQSQDIYRWTGSGWVQVPGKLSRVGVSAGGRRVVGVAPDGGIYVWLGSDWTRIPGALVNIDVADRALVGTNAGQEIFHIAL